MFISKSEKEDLQKKVENLSVLLNQALNRAQKSEEKISELSSKLSGLEEMQVQQQSLSFASKKATEDLVAVEKRFDDFVEHQTFFNAKAKEQIKILAGGQQMKNERIFAVERLLDTTRGVLFGLKKDMAANKKDFNDLCKIAVTRDEPAFALDGGQGSPEKAARKPRKSGSTKDTTPVELVTTPEAPYGLKKDGTPKKRPGRPLKGAA